MQPDPLPVVWSQGPGFLPDADRHCGPPDVVYDLFSPNGNEVSGRETASLGGRRRQLRYSGRVTDQVSGGEVGEVAHRRQRSIDRFALQHQLRARLAVESPLPRRPIGIEGEDFRSLVRKPLGDLWIERAARSLANDACGKLFSAQHALEGCVASHVNDPHGQRDLLAPDTTRLALAIPALGEVDEQRL